MKTSEISNQVAAIKTTLGAVLFAEMLKWNQSDRRTDAGALRCFMASKTRKNISKSSAVRAIRRGWELLITGRLTREQHRASQTQRSGPAIPGLTPKTITKTDLSIPFENRLREYKDKLAVARRARAAKGVYDLLPRLSGNTKAAVAWVDTFTAVNGHAETSWGDEYSRNCKYHKTNGDFTLWLPLDWATTVLALHLDVVDGLPTLAALPVASEIAGEEIFRAKWAEKSTGFSFRVVEGHIVRIARDGRTYTAHAKTISGARGLITRQVNAAEYVQQATRCGRVLGLISEQLAAGNLGNHAEVVVTLADSAAAGNCGTGTRSFVAKHFPGRTSATVAELIAVKDQHERVLLACLAAIRRHRSSDILAAA